MTTKKLPVNSVMFIFQFWSSEELQKFLESEEYQKALGSLKAVANELNVKKIEEIPNK